MIKKYHKILFVLIISSLLTGCWDYQDINRRNIRLSIGVDKIGDNIEFSGENANLLSGPKLGGEKIQIPTTNYYNASGKSLEEIKEKLDKSSPLEDFSGAMRVVVFGKGYAEEGIEPYINRVNHLTYLRKSLLIVVSREAPSNLFKSKITNDISIGYAIEDTIRQLYENGQCIYKTAQEVQAHIQNKDTGFILPYIGIEDKTIKLLGFAVMDNNKMIEIVTNENSKGFLYLLQKKLEDKRSMPLLGNKNNLYSIKTNLKKRKIKTNYADKKIKIDIHLKILLQLKYQYKTEFINESIIKELESEIAKEVRKDVLYAINYSQKTLRVDIFEFARYFNADNPNAFKEINWREEYPNADINVNVETKIKDINLINLNNKKKY